MDEVFDYIPLIGDFYRGWKIGNHIASYFSKNDEIDATLCIMVEQVHAAMDENKIERKLKIIDKVFSLSNTIDCQKKYQHAIMGYTLIMGGYIGAICYWQCHLWNVDARKELDEYFDSILTYCYRINNINITWFTDNDELVRNVQSRVGKIADQVRETKREMHKHYFHVDKVLHPWKYRLMWLIPLIIVIIAGIAGALYWMFEEGMIVW